MVAGSHAGDMFLVFSIVFLVVLIFGKRGDGLYNVCVLYGK